MPLTSAEERCTYIGATLFEALGQSGAVPIPRADRCGRMSDAATLTGFVVDAFRHQVASGPDAEAWLSGFVATGTDTRAAQLLFDSRRERRAIGRDRQPASWTTSRLRSPQEEYGVGL